MACRGCKKSIRRTLFRRRILIYAVIGGAAWLGYRSLRRA